MQDQVKVFKALSSESRLRILRLLKEHPQCVNAIATRLDMTQPAVSQHLRLLREAGLAKAEKRGNWMHYSIDREALERHGKVMAEILGGWIKPKKAVDGALNCPPEVLKECRAKTARNGSRSSGGTSRGYTPRPPPGSKTVRPRFDHSLRPR